MCGNLEFHLVSRKEAVFWRLVDQWVWAQLHVPIDWQILQESVGI
jgi:hypothetical protein